jgi:hypothetical protein
MVFLTDINRIAFDIFEGEGNSQEKLKRIFNKEISYNNSAMYIAGMKLLLDKLKDLRPEPLESEPDKMFYHEDDSKTLEVDIYLSPGEKATPATILDKMGLDPLEWHVMSCEVLKGHWDVTMKMENQEIVDDKVVKTSTPLTKRNRKYHVKIRVRPLVSELRFPQVLQAFQELPPANLTEYTYELFTDGLLYELPIMDFHFGKHAWNEESGDDYDLKIAEALWRKSFMDLTLKAKRFGDIEKIIFPIGQDFFHFDTPGVTTTAGTQLYSDSRWQKVFRKGVDLLVWSLEELRKIAPVKVFWIPGNHDRMLSYAAVVGVYQRYSETESVDVDLDAAGRKYQLFGRNLIGYTHGEKEGKRLEGLMQLEAAKEWGDSSFREFHMGHLHTEDLKTRNGIIFRRISAITGTDAWHYDNGFIGSTRQAQAFLWHKVNGLQAILNSNVVEMVEERG